MSEPISVTTKDIVRAWYDQGDDGQWSIRVSVKKDGQSGIIHFSDFPSKAAAKEFLAQLKRAVV